MIIRDTRLTRRQALAATGAGVLAASLGGVRRAAALEPIRQGYQTNMWGMPTYYLMHSGHLEKHGLKVQDFAVPSGNITMQQMVARQVELGTDAGPSLRSGYARGGLVAIAQIETVGKTVQVVGRSDLHMTKIEDLRGKKVANQTGSSVGNVFVDQVAPAHGLKPGDYQEVRMNVNDMVAALVAKTVDAMVNVEPYNALAEAQGVGTMIMNYEKVDAMPVFMATTPDLVAKSPDTLVAYLKAWIDVGKDFKTEPDKVADVIYDFYKSKGYQMTKETFKKAIATVDVNPGFPADKELLPYMKYQAEELVKHKKIKEVPDFAKVFLRQFMQKAMA